MSDQIAPPGPDRDAEIVLALGGAWATLPDPIDGGTIQRIRLPDGSILGDLPPYSTDHAACDRLVEEMVRRGYQLVHRADRRGHGARFMVDDVTASDGMAFYEGRGATRPDAVSAAALLALRATR